MGEAAKTYMAARKGERKEDRAQQDELPAPEAKALERLRDEAAAKGATLATGGKGGLPPSLVLGVMRRDEYRCHRCGKNQDLSLHHKGGIVASKWLSKKGHHMDFNNITTLCMKCHDAIHQQARRDGEDSSQVTPEGDKE
jgi:hypothetical protein